MENILFDAMIQSKRQSIQMLFQKDRGIIVIRTCHVKPSKVSLEGGLLQHPCKYKTPQVSRIGSSPDFS